MGFVREHWQSSSDTWGVHEGSRLDTRIRATSSQLRGAEPSKPQGSGELSPPNLQGSGDWGFAVVAEAGAAAPATAATAAFVYAAGETGGTEKTTRMYPKDVF